MSQEERANYQAARHSKIASRRQHEEFKAKIKLAECPQTPIDLLAELSADESPAVRIAVFENPSTSLALREMLSLDDDVDVRFAIAENHNSPEYLLRNLLRDDNPYVVFRANLTLQRIERHRHLAAAAKKDKEVEKVKEAGLVYLPKSVTKSPK